MLPWLLAWTRLIADEEVAVAVANEAVARAASQAKRLTGTALRAAARTEAARLLVRGVAAVPDAQAGAVPDAQAGSVPDAQAGSGEGSASPGLRQMSQSGGHQFSDSRAYAPPGPPDCDIRTDVASGMDGAAHVEPVPDRPLNPGERLDRALAQLAPYERLACVAYVLDGASTGDVAALLGVTHERAADILERAYSTIAAAAGESERPDFAALTGTQVEVVVR